MTKTMPQKEWSDFAEGPDPRQPDMVSREKVIELMIAHTETLNPGNFGGSWAISEINELIEKIRKL